MARKVSTETRQDLLQAVRERYRGSRKEEKLRILNEFVAVTGYHRKHVIRLFKAAPVATGLGRRARLPVYDEKERFFMSMSLARTDAPVARGPEPRRS